MEAYQIQSLTEQLIKLRKDKEKFNPSELEKKGYPIWIIRQHGEFLNTKLKEIEDLLKEQGITDIESNNIVKSEKKTKKNRKSYRSKKNKKQ